MLEPRTSDASAILRPRAHAGKRPGRANLLTTRTFRHRIAGSGTACAAAANRPRSNSPRIRRILRVGAVAHDYTLFQLPPGQYGGNGAGLAIPSPVGVDPLIGSCGCGGAVSPTQIAQAEQGADQRHDRRRNHVPGDDEQRTVVAAVGRHRGTRRCLRQRGRRRLRRARARVVAPLRNAHMRAASGAADSTGMTTRQTVELEPTSRRSPLGRGNDEQLADWWQRSSRAGATASAASHAGETAPGRARCRTSPIAVTDEGERRQAI